MTILSKKGSLAKKTAAVLAAVTLSLSAASCSSPEPKTGNVTDINIGTVPSVSALSLEAALYGGEMEEQGITIHPVINKSANDAIPTLLNGGTDLALTDTLSFLKARAAGLPLRVVAGMNGQATDGGDGVPSQVAVISRSDSDINGALDLQNQKVGVPGLKTFTWMAIRAIIDNAGGDSSTVDFVEVPPAMTMDLLARDQVAASTPVEPLVAAATGTGKAKIVHSQDIPGYKGIPTVVVVATEDFINNNPETVDKFATAIYGAAKKLNGSRDYALEVAENRLPFERKQIEHINLPWFPEEPDSEEDYRKITELALRYDLIREAPAFNDLVVKIGESR